MAELLNPKGKHGQGELFLQEFIETLKGLVSNSETLKGIEDLASAKVSSEYSTIYGRIDILIEFPNRVCYSNRKQTLGGGANRATAKVYRFYRKNL